MDDKTIAEAALAKPTAAEQTEYLEAACGDDLALRRRVEAILHTHEVTGALPESPAVEGVPAAPDLTAAIDFSTDVQDGNVPSPGGPDPLETRAELPPARSAQDLPFLRPTTRPDSLGRLAHYEVLQVLGKGGFGIVLKAFDEKLHRLVAIKVLGSQLSGSTTARKRFVREARAAAAVRDEHVVKVFDVEENPIPYLVMEYIAGETLQDRVDRAGPLEVEAILRIGAQIAAGLAAAHRQGEVHRDIKPANILLENGTDHAKITDFGLARAVDDATLTQSGVIAGTPMYMSPEQARGESVDHRSDLFSLGSVLYTLCTGRPPFRAAKTLGVLKRVCDDTPEPIRDVNPYIPDALARIVGKLMAKEREARFQTAARVADLLERHLARIKGPSAVPPGVETEEALAIAAESEEIPLPRKKRWARLTRWDWVGIVSLSAITVGVAGLLAAFLIPPLPDRVTGGAPVRPPPLRPGTLPPPVEIQRLLAQAQRAFQQHNLEEAIAACRAVIKLDPNNVQGHLGLGAALFQQGKREEAITAFRQAIALAPRDFRPHAMLGTALLRQDKLDEAVAEFHQAVALDPRNPELASMLAQTGLDLLKQNKWTEAEPLIRDCLAIREKLEPDAWLTFNTKSMLGGALLGQKKHAEAEPLLLAGYEGMKRQEAQIPPQGKPRLTEAVERLVQLYEEIGKKDEAAKWRKELEATKGADEKPKQANAAETAKVRAAVGRGQWQEVKALLAQSLEATPTSHDTWCHAAAVAAYLGDAEEYARCHTQLLERFGATDDPQVAERTAKACLLMPPKMEDLKRVERLAELAVAKGDEGHWIQPYAQFARGLAEYRRGNHEAAEGWVQKALAAKRADWVVAVPSQLVLAMSQQQRGQAEEAGKSLAQAVAILDKKVPQPGSPAVGGNWKDWLICQVLRREAEALIEGKKDAPKEQR